MTSDPLNWFLAAPDYHRVHHSAALHHGMNLAVTFRICDMTFGAYVNPDDAKEEFSLGPGERVEAKTVPRVLTGISRAIAYGTITRRALRRIANVAGK